MSKEIQSAISALIGKEKLTAIRILMGLESVIPVTAPTTLKEVKAKDGSVLSYEGDTPQAGAAITLKNDKGEMIPVPDGDVELEDGTILSVKDGKIADVKSAEKKEEKKEEAPKFDVATEMEKLKTKHKNEIIDLKALIATNAIAQKATEAKMIIQEEIVKQIFSIIEKIAVLPSATPAPKKDGFNKTSFNPGLDELMESAKQLSKQTFHN